MYIEKSKITIEDVAEAAGCSKTTVSRALSGKGRVSPDMKRRILSYCRKLGYRPKKNGLPAERRRTYNIAVLLPMDQELQEIPFFQQCMLGICETAESMSYDVLVAAGGPDEMFKIRKIVNEEKADGIIVMRALMNDPRIDYLTEADMPFVLIGDACGRHVMQVDDDSISACREMVASLLGMQMKKIALIGGNEEHTVTQKRLKGFYAGFETCHRKPDKKLIYLNCGTKADVFAAVDEILEEYAECIVCMDDKICCQVLLKLNSLHLSIPKDIKVASLYDSFFLQSYVPDIAAVAFDEKELGRQACEKQINKLDKGVETKSITSGYNIVLRGSTKCLS